MKFAFPLAIMLLLAASIAYGAEKKLSSKSDCAYCSELKKAEGKLRDKKTPSEDLDAYQLLVTSVVGKMTKDGPKISGAQVAALVKAFDSSLAKDPAKAIVINNIDVIKENRAAFDKEIAKLPKERANDFRGAIQTALGLEKPSTGFSEPD